ncbi:hypothetical protein ADUPG1_001168, partial [Aduncisulcus paluster]
GQDSGSDKAPEEGEDNQPSQKSEDPKRRSTSLADDASLLELVSFEEAPEDLPESPRSHKLTDEEVEALKAQATELEALKKKMAEEVPDDKKTATPEKHSTPQATEGKKPEKARRASVKDEEESNEDLG